MQGFERVGGAGEAIVWLKSAELLQPVIEGGGQVWFEITWPDREDGGGIVDLRGAGEGALAGQQLVEDETG